MSKFLHVTALFDIKGPFVDDLNRTRQYTHSRSVRMHTNGNGGDGRLAIENQRVLLVDDEEGIHRITHYALGQHAVELVSAFTNEDGLARFETHEGKFDVIAFDGHVDGSKLDTLELVERVSSSFSGPMVAISSDPAYRRRMVLAGCNHECDKGMFPRKALVLLGIQHD